jgi:hypothetical protein
MVHLQKFHDQYAREGLLVYAVAMLPGREKDRKLTRQLGVTYPVFYGPGSDLGRRYAYG